MDRAPFSVFHQKVGGFADTLEFEEIRRAVLERPAEPMASAVLAGSDAEGRNHA